MIIQTRVPAKIFSLYGAKPVNSLANRQAGSVHFARFGSGVDEVGMAFVALAKLHQLYDGYRQVFRLGGREWVLLQEDGRLYCIANQCPHLQAPLQRATIVNNILRCPGHGIEFDLRSGLALNPLACRHALTFLPLIYDANQVGLDVQ